MTRATLTAFDSAGMSIDEGSLSNVVAAQTGNMCSGVMNLATKVIYFGPLAKPAVNDHYETENPKFECFVAGQIIRPIVHNTENTSHAQLAEFVIAAGGGASQDDFCGFALRFEAGNVVKLAPTSRTLNPGYNGELEPAIMEKLYLYLLPKLAMLGKTLSQSAARITPDQAQINRGGVVIPRGLLAAIGTAK